jgi:hypothetical protein
LTESQKLSDVLWTWRYFARHWLDHVVEAKLQTLMLAVCVECGWNRPGGIEDRDHVAHPSLAISVSSSMPQTVILKEAVACTATRAVHPGPEPEGIFMVPL